MLFHGNGKNVISYNGIELVTGKSSEYRNWVYVSVTPGKTYTLESTGADGGATWVYYSKSINEQTPAFDLDAIDAGPTPWAGEVATRFARGTGTETDPYIIETPEQLAYLAQTTNAGTTYEGVYFKQGADINLGGVQAADGSWGGQNWIPIGNEFNSFRGNFDGNGYEIMNMYVDGNEYAGLFGFAENASFDQLNINGGFVSGNTSGAIIR